MCPLFICMGPIRYCFLDYKVFNIQFILGKDFSNFSNTPTVNANLSSPSSGIYGHCQDFSVVVVMVVAEFRITQFCLQTYAKAI